MKQREEMLRDLHRRIAQYEEEKKMKHSKIKSIFSTTKTVGKNEVNTPDEDGYIEVVSGTERIKSSNRMMHIVGTVAACSVLVASIGATGMILNKNEEKRATLSEESFVSTEAPEMTVCKEDVVSTKTPEEVPETPVYKSTDNGTISPFIDFKQIYFEIGCLNNYEYVEYSDATYDNLAVFLNNFNWGEGTDISEDELPDFNNYVGNGYMIDWRKGDVWFYVYVTDDGKAYYYMTKCVPDGNNFYYPISGSVIYDIDYEVFDKGIEDIWNNDLPDTSEYISKAKRMYLTQGEFMNAAVYDKGSSSFEEVVPDNDKTAAALQGFFREDFVGMLQKEKCVEEYYEIPDSTYEVVCYYKTSDTTTRRLTYFINSDGTLSLCEYEINDEGEIPTGCPNYYIDMNEFETVLNDILSGQYDDKYSFDATTTTATTSATETSTVTTVVQENVSAETNESTPYEDDNNMS